jgi:hypothetical protein
MINKKSDEVLLFQESPKYCSKDNAHKDNFCTKYLNVAKFS